MDERRWCVMTGADHAPHIALRRARQQAGLTEQQLATLTGLSRETIINVEQGRGATIRTITRMAAALGLVVALLPARAPQLRDQTVRQLVNERYGRTRGAA